MRHLALILVAVLLLAVPSWSATKVISIKAAKTESEKALRAIAKFPEDQAMFTVIDLMEVDYLPLYIVTIRTVPDPETGKVISARTTCTRLASLNFLPPALRFKAAIAMMATPHFYIEGQIPARIVSALFRVLPILHVDFELPATQEKKMEAEQG